MQRLKLYGFPVLGEVWSRIDDYSLSYQIWIRDRFEFVPLDVEFLLWMGKELPDRKNG